MNPPKFNIYRSGVTLCILILLILTFALSDYTPFSNGTDINTVAELPNDWFFRQRAYPSGQIDQQAYRKALAKKQDYMAQLPQDRSMTSLDTAQWNFAGPVNVGGRITDLEIKKQEPFTVFAGTASGGIFISNDEGQNWQPIFDAVLSLSIGDMALAPTNNDIIYVGTGEPNGGGGSLTYNGNGIYKSLDGGETWSNIGLNNVGSVGKVIVSPTDANVCLVGAMGPLFKKDHNRGVYKTNDGGDTWRRTLFLNDSTGIIDMAIHPQNPDIVYAASWERVRTVDRRNYGGPSSGIFKSVNGGETWVRLENGLPGSASRIGISISASNPNILYALFINEFSGYIDGIYKSEDSGSSWTKKSSDGISNVSYMWWFGKIAVDEEDPDIVYLPGFQMHKSTDGAESWDLIFYGAHVDQHAIIRHPEKTEMLIAGNDGGVYISENAGVNHMKSNRLPITQFYTCEADYKVPERLYGGAQDNGTVRTLTGAHDDWTRINGGDGFKVLVDPTDNSFVYSEHQYGILKRSIDGGVEFDYAMDGMGQEDRRNWNTPVVLNPNHPMELYYGSNYLYKSVDRAASWNAISPDLTSNPPQNNLVFGTITAISLSRVDEAIILIGTDDGIVQLTTDGGSHWNDVSATLPNRWVTSVATDHQIATTAYVTLSGYRHGTNAGHVFRTDDLGNSWMNISGDLPDIPVNDFIQVPSTGQLFLATDIGVYYSSNGGQNWKPLGQGIPNLVITDIYYHEAENFLIAATYGRGMYKISLEEETVSISNQKAFSLNSLTAFPNPFSDALTIRFNALQRQRYTVSIRNGEGRIVENVFAGNLDQGKQEFCMDTHTYPPGQYICTIRSGEQQEQIILIKI